MALVLASRRRPLAALSSLRQRAPNKVTVVGTGPAQPTSTVQIGSQQQQQWWYPYYSYSNWWWPYYSYSACPWGSYYDPYAGGCLPPLYGYRSYPYAMTYAGYYPRSWYGYGYGY